eukprot:gnl/Ergobibamus_cyprinoides/848.p1 GENE.gnl/Ergobibamus_cyprinoides/848~~gnl/Ergobibamus_cyprinoides/848.p1  ORF type:complete len:168 (+),score=9.87 gnl/Ergobibamus_cyprinoides/848:288-791(+)
MHPARCYEEMHSRFRCRRQASRGLVGDSGLESWHARMKKLNFFSPKYSVQTMMRNVLQSDLEWITVQLHRVSTYGGPITDEAFTHVFGTPSNPRSTKRSNNPLSRANDGLLQLDEGPVDGLQVDWLTSEAAAHWSTESYAKMVHKRCELCVEFLSMLKNATLLMYID